MSTEPLGHQILEHADFSSSYLPQAAYERSHRSKGKAPLHVVSDRRVAASYEVERFEPVLNASTKREQVAPLAFPLWKVTSPWTRSTTKRVFDCACVLLALPILIPIMLVVAVAVRLTSAGPALFLQERMGRYGRPFTILKFRTMEHVEDKSHHPITTSNNQRFTPIGRFLRRWKLDELPQLINVLIGDMSLVGPRPKMREHVVSELPCRPGITGMATSVFAREEAILARVPKDQLEAYFHNVVLPAKRQLDSDYMARATFYSDFQLIVNSVLRRWDKGALEGFLALEAVHMEDQRAVSKSGIPIRTIVRMPVPHGAKLSIEAEEASAG